MYIAIIIVWLILLVSLSLIIIKSNITLAEKMFNEKVMGLYHHLSDKVKTNETIIEGFAASVDAIGEINQEKIRAYAKNMLERYPHIFMFEMTRKIPHKNKKKFEKYYSENITPGFKIRSFGYESDRNWHATEVKDFYMPITFMEPFPPESRKVLGLDMNSNQFFIDSLKKSAVLDKPVATEPFTLVEGDLAYLLHRPIERQKQKAGLSDQYVMIVVLANSLFDDSIYNELNYDIRLYHRDFSEEDSKGYLVTKVAESSGTTLFNIFPKLRVTMPLESNTQPFNLLVQSQLGWNSINWWLLSAFFIAAIVSFIFAVKFAQAYHKSELNRLEEADNLFYMANHDSLTGLANRNLMMDRLQHALGQAKRNTSKLAVLFMDLDDFKLINDNFGHEEGDNLLRAVTERLRACLRSGDTLSRRSGDEFVLILENIENKEMVDQVIEKIKSAFAEKFSIKKIERKIGISIGYAIFPDETEQQDELLDLADKRMYKDKK